MGADPTSFIGSNMHKSLCIKKIKLNSPVLIIGYITFLFVICQTWYSVREPWYNC